MEVPDTASTTSSSKSSSSKASSNNEAGARSSSMPANSTRTLAKKHMTMDLADAILQRLQEHDVRSFEKVAPAVKAARSNNNEDNSNSNNDVPVWSQEPAVNALAVLLILKDLEEARQDTGTTESAAPQDTEQEGQQQQSSPKQGTAAHDLVQTVLKRLGDLGGWSPEELMGTDLSSLLQQLQSNSDAPTGGVPAVTEDSDSENKKPAQEKDFSSGGEETSAPAESSEGGSAGSASPTDAPMEENKTTQATLPKKAPAPVPAAAAAPPKEEAPKKKTTKQELLAALQQHLDILHQRGQVSSVIPKFLRPVSGTKPEEENQEQEASSTLAVRKAKRRRKTPTRDEYYEDLAAELLANSAVPIPDLVEVPEVQKTTAQSSLENSQPQNLTESEDSDLSVSLCSSGSTPNSSDFESSTGETTSSGTNTTSTGAKSTRRAARSVAFASTAVVANGNSTTTTTTSKVVARAVSTSSGTSGDPSSSSSSSQGESSSGEQQGESSS